MQRSLRHVILVISSCGLLASCGSGKQAAPSTHTESFTDPDNLRVWAVTASAVGVYADVYQPIAVADGHATFSDAACPVLADDGTTLTMTGDCTEASGTHWVGSATVTRASDGARALTLDGFGSGKTTFDIKTGEAHVGAGPGLRDFDVALTRTAGTVTTIDYAGEVQGDYDALTVWSGAGTVSRSDGPAPNGTVSASTSDEVVDDATCSGQPTSGTTTLDDMAGNTVVVTYDGATDCDKDSAATYTLNDEPKGRIVGISCAIASVERDLANRIHAVLSVFGLALIGLFRRRRSR